MNTIFVSVYPKPDGPNITQLCIDFNAFDPHEGIKFAVVMKNPAGIVIDKTYTSLTGDDWQDWPPEQTAGDDYNYVKNVVLNNLGYTEAIAPFITTQPVDQKVLLGESVEFSVVASGDSPLAYQWIKNAENIQGATSANYSIASVSSEDLASYKVNISNPVGSIDSSSVSLSSFQAPVITFQPQNTTLDVGQYGNLTVSAIGDNPLAFQWNKDGQAIIGASGSLYEIQNAQLPDSGNYFVTVTNMAGSVESNVAVLTINDPTPPPPTPPSPIPTGDNL